MHKVVIIHHCQHHTVFYITQASVPFIITIISCQRCNILQEQTHTVILKNFVVEKLYVSVTCMPAVGSLTLKRVQVLGGCPSKCIRVILIITAIHSCSLFFLNRNFEITSPINKLVVSIFVILFTSDVSLLNFIAHLIN